MASRNIVTAFRPHSAGLAKLFGSLEADIMDLIWSAREASARDVFEGLRTKGQRLSYGAVKTVLDRLVNKQVLQRTMFGNQYLYQAVKDRDEYTRAAVDEILGSLFDSFGTPVYVHFLVRLQASDPQQLEQLLRTVDTASRPANATED